MGIHPDLIQRLNRLDSLENENRSLRERNATLEAELAALRIGRKDVGTDVKLVLTGKAVEEIDGETARGKKVDLDTKRFGL